MSDLRVIRGSVIPEVDFEPLERSGIHKVFPPGPAGGVDRRSHPGAGRQGQVRLRKGKQGGRECSEIASPVERNIVLGNN